MTVREKFIFPLYASAVEIEIQRDHADAVNELRIYIHNMTAVPFPDPRDIELSEKLNKEEPA